MGGGTALKRINMEFKIPYTVGSTETLKRRAKFFLRFIPQGKREPSLQKYLLYDEIPLSSREYRAISLRAASYAFLWVLVIAGLVLGYLGIHRFLLLAGGIAFISSLFVFSTQQNYPYIFHLHRQRNIEKNLIPALQDMLVQLNSGIPLFNILVNLTGASYGELSIEFKKAVKQINAGIPQIEVLENLSEQNESPYFRRTLWQLSNGMRAGSDISIIIKENVRALNEEQLIQIQNYGNKLNPLIMFYMLSSVIMPALAVTFLTILSSMVSMPEQTTYLIFFGFFLSIMFLQIMFVGTIRSLRPSLL